MKTLKTVILDRVSAHFETKVGEPVALGTDRQTGEGVFFRLDDVVRGEGKVVLKLSCPYRDGDGRLTKEVTLVVEGK